MTSKANSNRALRNRHKLKAVSARNDRVRLSVYRSEQHIYAQVIDDAKGATLVSASTVDKKLSKSVKKGSTVEAAKVVGAEIGKRAKEAGVKEVFFDRGSFRYQGRIKALADAAREAGLNF
ncbi:MAG: 50S ribosomal protein L18 [Alphaproteobacteria bacterium]|jgi:large subunit ribosomal protein L18|nr:50S ribosomal protein L18 [Alphaproteobacteria bacterium]